jgi:hypothetical protein
VKGHLGIVGTAQIVQGGEDAAVDEAAAMRRDSLLHRETGDLVTPGGSTITTG